MHGSPYGSTALSAKHTSTKRGRTRSENARPTIRRESLFSYIDRSSDGSILEKPYRHLSRQTDATVRRGKGRDVSLMHCITASKEHRIGHSRAIEMTSFRTAVLSCVDIRSDDISIIIHVIPEYARDVVRTFRKHRV